MDDPQLPQALMNLLRNAREAMPEEGTLEVRLFEADGGVVLEVDDAGPGIADADRESVFDLFYTTKQYGTGLGLPLTQQTVVTDVELPRQTGHRSYLA